MAILTRLLMGLIFCSILLTSTPAQAASIKDQAFVTVVREDWAFLDNKPPKLIVRAGKEVCSYLTNGYRGDMIVRFMKSQGDHDVRDLRRFVKTSTLYYCPWFKSRL